MIKKLFVIFLLAIFGFSLIVPKSVLAQTDPVYWWKPDYKSFNEKVNDKTNPNEIFGERYTQAQVYWIAYSLITLLAESPILDCAATSGDSPDALQTCVNDATATTGNRTLGPIMALASGIERMHSTPPASGVQYIAQNLRHFHLIPEASAQGFGYTTLLPIQNLWRASRNMAYGLMVLVFLVFAFMIMLRVKLSPQTVISVQSVLPKVVITMIVIWFSFAIAGLLIDLSYLVQGIFATFIYSSGMLGVNGVPSSALDLLLKINSWPVGIFAFAAYVVILVATYLSAGVGIASIVTLGAAFAPVGGVALVAGVIVAIIMLIVFLYALVRIFWMFLKSYVTILLLIFVAPFQLLLGTIMPGMGIVSWIKSIVAQLSVFVTITVMILIANVLFWSSQPAGNAFYTWQLVNPFGVEPGVFTGSGIQLPGFANVFDISTLGFFAGFVLVITTPSFATKIRDMISAPGRFELGLGQAFGPYKMVGQGGAQYASAMQQDQWAKIAATPGGVPTPSQVRQNAFFDALGRVGIIRRK